MCTFVYLEVPNNPISTEDNCPKAYRLSFWAKHPFTLAFQEQTKHTEFMPFKRRHFLLFSSSAFIHLGLSGYSVQRQKKRNSHSTETTKDSVVLTNNRTTVFSDKYQVTINMSQDTVKALSESNYSLYCFRAVQCWHKSGMPLVWRRQGYSLTTIIEWSEEYEVYTSPQKLNPGIKLGSHNSYPIELGQKFLVDSSEGLGKIKQNGVDDAIAIYNQTQRQFTCGISVKTENDTANPICALPIFGDKTQVIIPLNKILLLFSTMQVKTSTAILKAESSGILIDLTKAPENLRTVNYNINKGWEWGEEAWAQTTKASTNLNEVLITDPPSGFNPGTLVITR